MTRKKIPLEEEIKTWDRYQFTQKLADGEVARYVEEKKAKEARQILVDGVYRDPDDLDGKKEARRNKREKVISYLVTLAIFSIIVWSLFMCFKLSD